MYKRRACDPYQARWEHVTDDDDAPTGPAPDMELWSGDTPQPSPRPPARHLGARRRARTRDRRNAPNGLRVSGAPGLVLECLLVADGPVRRADRARHRGRCFRPTWRRCTATSPASSRSAWCATSTWATARPVRPRVAGEREYLTCERCADFEAVGAGGLDDVRAAIEDGSATARALGAFPDLWWWGCVRRACGRCVASRRSAATAARGPCTALLRVPRSCDALVPTGPCTLTPRRYVRRAVAVSLFTAPQFE